MAYLTNHNKFDCVAKKDLDEKATIAQLQVCPHDSPKPRLVVRRAFLLIRAIIAGGGLHVIFLLLVLVYMMVGGASVLRR